MFRKLIVFATACWIVLSGAPPSNGQGLQVNPEVRGDLINDVEQSTVVMHPATRYVESTTFALLDLDISKIKAEATADWLLEFGIVEAAAESNQAVAMVNGFIESLRAAGVDHLYLTGSTRSLIDGGPLVIIPCDNPPVVNGLASVLVQMMSKEFPQSVHVGEETVLAGAKPVVDRVIGSEGTERADLILPLANAKTLDHALVLALPEEARRELMAFWPDRLPAGAPLQFSPRQMVEDIEQLLISFSLPPDARVEIRLQATDAVAAERIMKIVQASVALVPPLAEAIEIEIDIANVSVKAGADAFAQLMRMLAAPARHDAQQRRSINLMKQMGLAIHNYHDAERHLPPRSLKDGQGNLLHSWRVALLPYLGNQALYKELRLDQSWNSDVNRVMTNTTVESYSGSNQGPMTTLRAPVFPGSVWHGEGPPPRFRDVTDGLSNTIAIIDAPARVAVPWADPQPWVLSQDDPVADVFGDRDRVTVLILDGSVRVFTREELDNHRLKAMLTFAGGEPVN